MSRTLRPHPGQCPLLPDTRFIGEPYFHRFAGRLGRQRGGHEIGKAALKTACSWGLVCGCCGRAERALVLSVDEKSQVSRRSSTQPGLPHEARVAARTMTHDYKRHGTTTLFAALDVKTGTVIGRAHAAPPRHRVHPFPPLIDADPASRPTSFAADNYAAHKNPKRKRGSLKASALPPAFHPDQLFLVKPCGAAVRRTDKRQLKRGVFSAVPN